MSGQIEAEIKVISVEPVALTPLQVEQVANREVIRDLQAELSTIMIRAGEIRTELGERWEADRRLGQEIQRGLNG